MNAEDVKILIGIPSLSEIKTETTISLVTAISHLNYRALLHVQKSCYVHDARNKIVETALERKFTHVMFIDSDMSFPGDAMNTLVERDLDIVGGLYYRRQPPHWPTLNILDDGKLKTPTEFPLDRLFEVWGIATGFLLIKTSVFEKIKPPYFFFSKFNGKDIGEDYHFCKLAHESGFKVWCDPTFPLGHIGEYCFDQKDFDAYNAEREKNNEDTFEGEL